MERCFPTKGLNPRKYNLVRQRDELIAALNDLLPRYEINNYNRVVGFLGCTGVETDYYKTTSEYASGADYEGRRDLGNTVKGDGKRFKGSGVIQTTGRYNFFRVMVRFVKKLTGKDYTNEPVKCEAEADRLGVNFLKNPEKLREDIRVAVEAACIFWQENNLNKYADTGRIKELNGVVNRGGPNKTPLHWEKRWELHQKVRKIIPHDISFAEAENGDGGFAPTDPVTLVGGETGDVQPIDLDKAQASVDKASATLQNPSVATLAKRAGGRLVLGLGTVWGTTAGKVALILTALVILGVLGGVAYSYRKQLQLGAQIARATAKKFFGGFLS